jgi:NAD(P)H-flavin reductase
MATRPAEPAPAGAAGGLVPTPCRVGRRLIETADTHTLELFPERAGAIAPFAPGQFAMLYAFGAGEAPISISGDLSAGGRLVHTIRSAGAVTSALCALEPGDHVGVRGPFGTAWPLEPAEGADVVVVAGGIGLAPLRPAVYQLMRRRERYGRVAILYGGRSPAELLYVAELERWRGRFDVQVEVIVDGAPSDWRGQVGVVTKLIPRAELDPKGAFAFVCGPELMMRFTAAALAERGFASERVFLSLERSMHCAIGLCGHCQLQHLLLCRDGPVFALDAVEPLLRVREL